MFIERDENDVCEYEKFGWKVDTVLTHWNYLLFKDETGCSTFQKEDGHGVLEIVATIQQLS